MANSDDNANGTQDLLNVTAAAVPHLQFASLDGITGISAPHVAQATFFNQTLESAKVLTPIIGQAGFAAVTVAMITGSPLAAGATGLGVAFNGLTKSGKGNSVA